jgi:hypothetical protein
MRCMTAYTTLLCLCGTHWDESSCWCATTVTRRPTLISSGLGSGWALGTCKLLAPLHDLQRLEANTHSVCDCQRATFMP